MHDPLLVHGPVISRIAPTPSGYLHAGNAFSFLLTWLLVGRSEGRVNLRIDDSDADRKRPEYVADIFRVLDWLGLDFDAGPSGPDDFEKHWSQTLRTERYESALRSLARVHPDLVFACDCSRSLLGGSTSYPGTCATRGLPLDTGEVAWRLSVARDVVVAVDDVLRPALTVPIGVSPGSFVVRRRDRKCAYQVVSILEDETIGTNFIVRGADLLESSAMQIYAGRLFDIPSFEKVRFLHHSLVADARGGKLSKSTQAPPLSSGGFSAESRVQLIDDFSAWIGQAKGQCASASDLLNMFRAKRLEEILAIIPR